MNVEDEGSETQADRSRRNLRDTTSFAARKKGGLSTRTQSPQRRVRGSIT